MLTRINFNKHFQNIIFDEKNHTYTVNGKKFISCTTLLHKYKNDTFQDGQIAQKFAIKKNLPLEYVTELWKMKALEGTTKGTLIHWHVESFLKFGIKTECSNLIEKEVQYFHNFLKDNPNLRFIRSEYVIYDADFEVAGTLDCLFQDRITGEYILIDWKTNKEISLYCRDNYNYPIDYLDQSDINGYSLQLSLYRKILEKYIPGFKISRQILVHLNSKCNDNYKIFECKFLENEINNVLSNYRENK